MKLSATILIAAQAVSAQEDYGFDYSSLTAEVNTLGSGAAEAYANRPEDDRYGATTTAAPDPTLPGVTLAGGPMLAGQGCFHCDATGATTAETYEMCATIGEWKECPAGDNYYCMYEGRTESVGATTETVSMCTGCKAQDSCINNVLQNFQSGVWSTMTQCRPEGSAAMGRRFRSNNQASVCRTCFNPCDQNSELCFQAGAGEGGVTQNSMVAGVFGIPHSVSDTPTAGTQTGAYYMDPSAQTDRAWWGMGTTNTAQTQVEEWQDTNINDGNTLATLP